MSSTSSSDAKQVPVLTDTQDALNLLANLAFRRREKSILNAGELKQIDALLRNFLLSPALRTAPSKNQLLAAVNALLPQGASMVSTKFNKPQLAAVLQKWVHEAELLSQPETQNKLFIEIKLINGSKRNIDLSQAIYIEEDDGSVAALSISSPGRSARDDQAKAPISHAASFLADFPMTPRTIEDTPTSVATSASSFARQVHGVASLQTLAATDVADPGVHGETAPASHGAPGGGGHLHILQLISTASHRRTNPGYALPLLQAPSAHNKPRDQLCLVASRLRSCHRGALLLLMTTSMTGSVPPNRNKTKTTNR